MTPSDPVKINSMMTPHYPSCTLSIKCLSQWLFVIPETNVTMSDSTHSLDHSATLSDDLGQIFDSGDGCDFHITVQSATGNKQEDGTPEMLETKICAHRMIVSQFPFFSTSMGMTSITVNVSQSCQPHFTSFIRYKQDCSHCWRWCSNYFIQIIATAMTCIASIYSILMDFRCFLRM